uniref:Uncharacterized protein n=1 Tax=viral metagenome TaxID=1070528 RepID=A0A6C0HGJ1_9ZZZZ
MFINRPASISQEDQESYLVKLKEHIKAWLERNIDEKDYEEEGKTEYLKYLYAFMHSGSYNDMRAYQTVYLEILDVE